MPSALLMPDSAILPDGTILLTNGIGWGQAGGNAGQCQYKAAPVFTTNLYSPENNTWSFLELNTVARMYHSGAIRLNDGSVITTGSEMADYLEFWGTPTTVGPLAAFANLSQRYNQSCFLVVETACNLPRELRIEQYTPKYLTSGNLRPIVKPFQWGTMLTYNSTVEVQLDSTGADIDYYDFVVCEQTVAIFRIPPNGSVAPLENLHVFAVSGNGVPSVAQTVLLGNGTVTTVAIPTSASTSFGTGIILSIITLKLNAMFNLELINLPRVPKMGEKKERKQKMVKLVSAVTVAAVFAKAWLKQLPAQQDGVS
ncbi:hypothetical protein HK100_000262 [Physocladia obscura]|uniref:Glyoxal oxidase N-terminal domain-containing protein n=1 Tax=Physocladia obscura TaxID=109957 RepID=A0AAD5T9J6_9FUNG|nr:hypothetical protein HK100_000262 [Physocladia obscura]